MSACIDNDTNTSTLNTLSFHYLNEHPPKPKPKQGITTILGCDCDGATKNRASTPPLPTLRRTLSADMSSRKWLAENGFSNRLKKIASSKELQSLSAEGGDSGESAFDAIWKSIQDGDMKKEIERPGASDVWSSILSQKANDPNPPYIHPLVKRSTSSLSEKSLEICTESLGSETGSDGFSFSSDPMSEPGDSEDEETRPEEVVKYKRAPARSFPPPLPSLAHRHGSNVQMRSHRQDGRLVLEAVAIPSQNRFRAQRQNGRLLLTLAADNSDTDEYEEDDEKFEEIKENEIGESIKQNNDLTMLIQNMSARKLPAAMSLQKLLGFGKTSTWPHKFNTAVKVNTLDDEMETVETIEMTPATLNPYERYWRPTALKQNPSCKDYKKNYNSSMSYSRRNKLVVGQRGKRVMEKEKQEMVVVKGEKEEYLVPLVRGGCKQERRRSLLFWEPYCIATS